MAKKVVGENSVEIITGGTKTRKAASWGLIVLMWVFFFPAAIAMTVVKLKNEKHSYVDNGKVCRVIGYVWLGILAFYILAALTGGVETQEGDGSVLYGVAVLGAVCGGIGLPFVIMGNKYVKLGKRNNKYINLVTSGELNLDNIAHVVGVPYETVVKDLKEMIEDGYFKGAYVNDYGRQLVMPYSNKINSYGDDSIAAAPKITNKIVKCPNCGATNTIIVGAKSECEYCGTPLE